MSGPLSSLTVIEFTGLGPAPLAGQLLADLGARVIAIDRASAPADATDINRRGKKCIALDLKQPVGRDVALKLIAQADIVIEGFRPGVMERLGLGPQDCPDHVIYARMTGWGQDGPWAQNAGHDINYLAITGALHAMGPADQPPPVPLNLVADFGGGTMFLIFGILAAVIDRSVSGKGQVVDAAMTDGVTAMMGLIFTAIARDQWRKGRHTNWLQGASHFYRCYKCSDGKFLAVGALEPQFFAQLIEIAGLPEAWRDSQHDPEVWPAHVDVMTDVFRTRTRDAWAEVFEGTDACVTPVLDFSEATLHPQNTTRSMFYQQGGVWQPRTAPRFGNHPPERAATPHGPGEDSQSVLADIGYTEAEIDAMAAGGILT